MEEDSKNRLERAYAWWCNLREDGAAVPLAEAFTPSDLPDLAPSMFLMERNAAGSYEIVYWGSYIVEVSGKVPERGDYLDRFVPADAEQIGQYLTYITGRPCGGVMQRDVTLSAGRCLHTWNLALPFVSGDGLVRHVGGYVDIQKVKQTIQVGLNLRQNIRSVVYIDLGEGIPEGMDAAPF